MIGLLTETIGNPTPFEVPLVPERQLPNRRRAVSGSAADLAFPHVHRIFDDRQSRRARPGFEISRGFSVQHLPDGPQFHPARQPGFLDHYAQAHRSAGRSRREANLKDASRVERAKRRTATEAPRAMDVGWPFRQVVCVRTARSRPARSARLHPAFRSARFSNRDEVHQHADQEPASRSSAPHAISTSQANIIPPVPGW